MRVVNLRDAIILSMLKDKARSRGEIEGRLDIQKSVASQSLALLHGAGLIDKKRARGSEFYAITNSGRRAIDGVYKRLSIA